MGEVRGKRVVDLLHGRCRRGGGWGYRQAVPSMAGPSPPLPPMMTAMAPRSSVARAAESDLRIRESTAYV